MLEDTMGEGAVISVGVPVEYLQQVSDHRGARGKRYSVPFIMAMIVLTKLFIQNKLSGIAE